MFSVEKYSKAYRLISDHDFVVERIILPEFKANLVVLKNCQAIVIPNMHRFVVIFESKELAISYLQNNEIPLDLDEVFYQERLRLRNFEQSKAYYFEYLSNVLGIQITPTLDENHLDKIGESLERSCLNLTFEERWKKFAVPIGVFVGECLLVSSKYTWIFDKKILINPIVEPNLVHVERGRIFIWITIRSLLEHPNYRFFFIKQFTN